MITTGSDLSTILDWPSRGHLYLPFKMVASHPAPIPTAARTSRARASSLPRTQRQSSAAYLYFMGLAVIMGAFVPKAQGFLGQAQFLRSLVAPPAPCHLTPLRSQVRYNRHVVVSGLVMA